MREPATRAVWRGSFFSLLGGLVLVFVGPARLATLGQIVPAGKPKPATIIFNLQVLLGFGLAPVIIGVVRSHAGWPTVFCHRHGLVCRPVAIAAGHPDARQRQAPACV